MKKKDSAAASSLNTLDGLWIALIVLAFVLGVGVRLYDLQDAPLDFHPTRQLHSALIARGMYYHNLPDKSDWQREMAFQQWQTEGLIEPQIMERLTAVTYQLLGCEHLWAARIWAILFWSLGGILLCWLAKDLFGLTGAAMAVIYYMIWPYAVISSRAFQPESLLVAALIASWWAIARWLRQPSLPRAILAGVLCGLVIYVKSVAVFFIAPPLAGLLLANYRFSDLLKNKQVWWIFALLIVPYFIYHVFGVYVLGLLGSQFSLRFFPNLWLEPVFYLQWINELKGALGLEVWLTAMVCLLILPEKRWRGIFWGLLCGYLLYGFTFAYHISTHDYYQMPMLPVTALGLAAVFSFILEHLQGKKALTYGIVSGALLVFMLLKGWDARVTLKRVNYDNEVRFWQKLGEQLGHQSRVTGLLTDYGYRLAYWGWVDVSPWLQTSDIDLRLMAGQEVDFAESFRTMLQDKDYFVVTLMDDFARQPELQQALNENYPLLEQSDELIIYDLRPE